MPATGNALNQWFAPSAEGGYYFNAPTQDWVNCFTEQTAAGTDDPRIDASIGREGVEWFEEGPFESAWAPATGYLVKKHNQPLSEVDAGRKGDGGLAYIYLRYADILLMEAECQNEENHPDLAASPLNRVRERAGLAPVPSDVENNQAEMRNYIRTERRRELGFEFHRFFDQQRWGDASSRYYFPIPQTEMDSNLGIED